MSQHLRHIAFLALLAILCLGRNGPGQIFTSVTSTSNGTYTSISTTVLNDTSYLILFWHYPALVLVTADGELASPRHYACNDAISGFSPGTTAYPIGAFPNPPSTPVSYVLYFTHGSGAVARVDFGGVAPGFPDIHVFPSAIFNGFTSHAFDPWFAPTNWSIGNVSQTPFTFGASDALTILPAAGGPPVAVIPLAGLVVAPGKVLQVTLPALPPAPYMVEVVWTDPSTGPEQRRIGVRDHQQLDLHFPEGRDVPFGGSVSALVNLKFSSQLGSTPTPSYALALGILPATTVLPGAVALPLGLDSLALASLNGGLSGLLQNNIGTPTFVVIPFCLSDHFLSAPIVFNHPNTPALSGLVLRVAAAAYHPGLGTWGASQPAEIRLQ